MILLHKPIGQNTMTQSIYFMRIVYGHIYQRNLNHKNIHMYALLYLYINSKSIFNIVTLYFLAIRGKPFFYFKYNFIDIVLIKIIDQTVFLLECLVCTKHLTTNQLSHICFDHLFITRDMFFFIFVIFYNLYNETLPFRGFLKGKPEQNVPAAFTPLQHTTF